MLVGKGKIFTEFQSYVVTRVEGDKVFLKVETGQEVELPISYIENLTHSADYFEKEEKLTRTLLIEKFIASSRIAITAGFYKKDQKKTAKVYEAEKQAKIEEIQNASLNTAQKLLNNLIDNPISKVIPGEFREIKGYHYGQMNEFGRINFIDREAVKPPTIKQVDPRTLEYIIVDKVKYILKK